MPGGNKGGSAEDLSRRDVLKLTGGAAAVGLATGVGVGDGAGTVEVNVGFHDEVGKAASLEAAENLTREFGFGAVTMDADAAAISALENNPNIDYVERNGEMHAHSTVPYGIEQVNADVAIDTGHTGDGVSIGILDTGVDANHETLAPHIGEGYAPEETACQDDCESGFFCGANEISTCYAEWDDDNDHGTHVAGTAAAIANDTGVLGVAPDATIHPVKVLDCCGSGGFDSIAAGIEWCVEQDLDVINMSLGGSSGSDLLKDAIEHAAENGLVIVSSAGNDGDCEDCVGYPAAYPESIAVSATDENDDLAEFSSTGPEVDIAAPGVDTLSSVPRDDYEEFSGTSMSAPHVAGAAASVIADGVTDREEVRQRLKDGAEDVGLAEEEQGAGRLDVEAALDIEDDDDDEDDDEDDDDDEDVDPEPVDPAEWPTGTGSDGDEHLTLVDLDGQTTHSSSASAYEDATAEPVVVSPGGSFEVSLEWDDGGFDEHYANVIVDWDGNQDFSTAAETAVFADASDDSSPATATVDVPADAAGGGTLCRVRLSWGDFEDPDATDEFGEVNDFTVFVDDEEDDDDEDDDDDDDEPEPAVEVSTGGATDVEETSATVAGTLEELENLDSADAYFEYGPSGTGLGSATGPVELFSPDGFERQLFGLSEGTTYEYRAVAAADGANDVGTVRTFTTDEEEDDDDENCFITTATHRKPGTLDSLRRFRDDSMSRTTLGQAMVGLYYRISPPIADTLERHPDSLTTRVTRKLVRTCAGLSDAQAETDSRLRSMALGTMLTVLYMVGIVVAATGHAGIRTKETLS